MMLGGCSSAGVTEPSFNEASIPETGEQESLADEAGAHQTEPAAEQEALTGEMPETAAEMRSEGTLTVTFLDVGQGNAVLVENEGLYMLIDGGDKDASSFVVSYLKKQGVEELAYVISSHYDADHLNGVVGALHAFSCDTVLAADYTADTKIYQSFCDVVEEKDISLVYPAMGDTYTLGEAEFTIVCPDAYDYADENDNSVGIRLVYGENSFLICGDAGFPMEQIMMQSGLELDSDVYLASHHGSERSSSLAFLQAVSPEAVVISVGADNSYGHPAQSVLEDIRAVGAEVYRTDEQGTIVVKSDGSTLSWSVETTENASPEGTMAQEVNVTEDNALPQDEPEQNTYILNRNTKKFHLPSCSSAEDISVNNKAEFTGTRQELIDAGYEPCKRCNP